MQLCENDIIIYELSQNGEFNIKSATQRQQSSRIDKEVSNNSECQQIILNDSQNSIIIIDNEEPEKETFPTGKIKTRKVDQNHVQNMMIKFRIQVNTKGFSGKRGLTGLQNLGNTCFMNSSLQCLSNVQELTTFMVNNDYVNDLNPDNPLGASGHLAVSYADLVSKLWQGYDSSVSPHYLKKVIGKFAPQFYGYSQQDSQELLSYLLDGLHEDLNRIKKKPIVEDIDYSGGKDQQASLQFFQNYKKRNDSVISDLMVGQFKSTLICPNKQCGKISITFDPFLTLSVPIPRITKEDVQFYVVFKDPRKIPQKIETQVRSDSSIGDLKNTICENLKLRPEHLMFVNTYQSVIEEFIYDSQSAVHLKEISGIPFVFEIEKKATPIQTILKQAVMEEENQQKLKPMKNNLNNHNHEDAEEEEKCKKNTQNKLSASEQFIFIEVEMAQIVSSDIQLNSDNITDKNIHNISYSRLISLRKTSTVQDLYLNIYKIIRVYFNLYKQQPSHDPQIKVDIIIDDDSCEQLNKEIQEFESNSEQQRLFRIFNKDMKPINHNNLENILSLTIKNKNRLYVKLIIDSSFIVKQLRSKRCETSNLQNSKLPKEPTQNSCNLYDCIDQFVKKEQLEKGNEWYCSKCKKHVLATKQMEIYQTPKILIIHLKRFKSGSVSNYGRYYFESGGKKISDHIDFPIENLNMTKYILGQNGKTQIYDLFAVSQHYGGMGGGHYTACAYNFITKRWHNFNDSSVSSTSPDQAVSNAAYVLFYRRRD